MINEKTNQLAKTALIIALIFVGTFSIRIPNPATWRILSYGRQYDLF